MRFSVFSKVRPERKWLGPVLFWTAFIGLQIFYVHQLFGGGQILAGGDNYPWLRLGREGIYPYLWDIFYPFGVRSFTAADLFGLPLYSLIFGSFSPALVQRIIVFFLLGARAIAYLKLFRLLGSKLSYTAALPTLLFLSFNPFESLNPYTLSQLLYDTFLPLALYYFIRIFESEKSIWVDTFKLLFLTLVFSPINSNPALSVTIFIPPGLYLLLNHRRLNYRSLTNLFVLSLGFFGVSLWWLYPLFYYFRSAVDVLSNSASWFAAISVGSLAQNFRLIGQWAWYSSHFLYPYYPYSAYYDKPLLIVVSYLLVGVSIFEAAKFKGVELNGRLRTFFFGLLLLSLLLINGSRPPLGLPYQFLFNTLSWFRVFREPFTKFSELYVLPVVVFLYLFLVRLEGYFTGFGRVFIFSFFFLVVFLFIRPMYFGLDVIDHWNGSVRTQRVSVPDYWEQFESYARQNLPGRRFLTAPEVAYGNAWNWPKGFSSADDVAAVFVPGSTNILRQSPASGPLANRIIDTFFEDVNRPELALKRLSLLGVNYVLQENDLDWRYSSSARPPSEMNRELSAYLTVEKTFGRFTPDYLKTIPNEDPNPYVRQSLYDNLSEQPALVLYRVPQDFVVPKIWAPKRLIVEAAAPSGGLTNLPSDYRPGDVLVNSSANLASALGQVSIAPSSAASGASVVYDFLKAPEVEFREVNPTKYYVQVKNPPSYFWLNFNERFDSGWKLYPVFGPEGNFKWGSGFLNEKTFETIFRMSLSETNHFLTNGYANGWLIGREINGRVSPSGEATYVLEYEPQRVFYLSVFLAAVTLVAFFALSLKSALKRSL